MKISLKPILLPIVLLLTVHSSFAALITTDLTITGFAEFDTTSDPFVGTGSQNGGLESVIGGTSSSSTVSDVIVAGSNPLGGGFTMTGDGVGASAQVIGDAGDIMDGFFFDFDFNLMNSSLLDDYLVSFGIRFSNSVGVESADAYIDSEIVLENAFDEIFASDLTSDSLFGDEKNGIATGTFGDDISDSGLLSFDIFLGANSSTAFGGFLKMDGEEFANVEGYFSGNSSAFIYIQEVAKLTPPNQVPTPATFMLFLTGSLGLLARKYLTKK